MTTVPRGTPSGRRSWRPRARPSGCSTASDSGTGVEAAERRRDAQLAREVQLALPRELGSQAQWALALGFVEREFVGRGMVADLALHGARTYGGDEAQDHVHVMLTMRVLTAMGFGGKAREWNATALLEHWRAAWGQAVNEALAAAGSEARVDHRTLVAQRVEAEREAKGAREAGDEAGARAAERRAVELDREPEPKRGVRADVVDARDGREGERRTAWEAVRARNAERRRLLMERLACNWELRELWAARAQEVTEERRAAARAEEAEAARDEALRALRLRRASLAGLGGRFAAAGRAGERRRAERVRVLGEALEGAGRRLARACRESVCGLEAELAAADREARAASFSRAVSVGVKRAMAIERAWAAHWGEAMMDASMRVLAAAFTAKFEQLEAWHEHLDGAARQRLAEETAAWTAHDVEEEARRCRQVAAADAATAATAAEVAAWESRVEASRRRRAARWRREKVERERIESERRCAAALDRARAARGAETARWVRAGLGTARRVVGASAAWVGRVRREREARREAAHEAATTAELESLEGLLGGALRRLAGLEDGRPLRCARPELQDRGRYLAALEAAGLGARAARASWEGQHAALDGPLAARLEEQQPQVEPGDTLQDVLREGRGLALSRRAASHLDEHLPATSAVRAWVAGAVESARAAALRGAEDALRRLEEAVGEALAPRAEPSTRGLARGPALGPASNAARGLTRGDGPPPPTWEGHVAALEAAGVGAQAARASWDEAHARLDELIAVHLEERQPEVRPEDTLGSVLGRGLGLGETLARHLAEHLPAKGEARWEVKDRVRQASRAAAAARQLAECQRMAREAYATRIEDAVEKLVRHFHAYAGARELPQPPRRWESWHRRDAYVLDHAEARDVWLQAHARMDEELAQIVKWGGREGGQARTGRGHGRGAGAAGPADAWTGRRIWRSTFRAKGACWRRCAGRRHRLPSHARHSLRPTQCPERRFERTQRSRMPRRPPGSPRGHGCEGREGGEGTGPAARAPAPS